MRVAWTARAFSLARRLVSERGQAQASYVAVPRTPPLPGPPVRLDRIASDFTVR